MVECKISMGTVNRILTVCVGILVAVTSVLTLITFGLGNISAFIMSIYYLYSQYYAASSQWFSS